MMMINQSALANAVINITANTQGFDAAIGETKKRMHGFMVFAEAMGGRTGGFLANMLATGGARPVLGSVFGQRIGGGASDLLKRLGVMQDPVQDIDAAMTRAKADFARESYRHKMAAGGLQIGGTFNGQPIRTPVDLRSARLQHARNAPTLQQSIDKFVPAAVEPAQRLAMAFAKYAAILNLGIASLKALIPAGEELRRSMRRASRLFGGREGEAMRGHGGVGSIMSRAEFAAGATGIGVELNQKGLSGGRGAEMASSLASRAGEIAASWGDAFEDVAGKVQKAIGGSNDALAEYGVVLSDDLVRARAFNSGMIRMGETMSAATEAQARFDLILSQTNKSVETGWESFFNLGEQWSTLMANFKSVLSSIGAPLAAVTAMTLGFANALTKFVASPIGWATKNLDMTSSKEGRAALGLPPLKENEDTIGRARDDAARAAEIIQHERRRQSSNVGFHRPEDFYNHIQRSIFGDPTEILKRQTDLLHEFLLVSKEQAAIMKDFGYKVKNGSFLIAN